MHSYRIKVSKFLSYILRHHPGKYDLAPDKNGFVSLKDVVEALKKRFKGFRDEEIFDLVSKDPKGRFEIKNEKISATYGHSIEVSHEAKERTPPEVLYHGTSPEGSDRILSSGLKPMNRQFVHLSLTESDAYMVGSRHSKTPVILKINALKASQDGIKFYREGNTFLAREIPPEYISKK